MEYKELIAMLKKLYQEFWNQTDADSIKKHTAELAAIEMGQTFPDYHKAAAYTLQMLKDAGIPNAEITEFPADGKTAYQDKRMPLGWTASVGKLSIVRSCGGQKWEPVGSEREKPSDVLADYRIHPFHLVKGSTALPEGGVVARLITEQQFLAGEDPRGAIVLFAPHTLPRSKAISAVLDQGAIGFVTDYLKGRFDAPRSLQWLNAGTDAGDWHVTCEDRPFVGFCVSPETGDRIRELAAAGELTVKAECDGRRYPDTVPAVSALIPGKQKKEVWIIAHLYEPLLDDDACGVAVSVEIAKMIMRRGTPEYSVRLVFAMELYGYAAYTEKMGLPLSDRVVGACNLDTPLYLEGYGLNLHPAGPAVPFAGNHLIKQMYSELKDELSLRLCDPAYFDDNFLCDPCIGIPTVWILGCSGHFWHNSFQCQPSFISTEILRKCAAFECVFIYMLASDLAGKAEPQVFPVREKHSHWRDYADQIVMKRQNAGFPFSLVKIPREDRIDLPDGMLYGPFANILANMDGKKSLARLIAEAEAETGTEKGDGYVKKIVNTVNYLADYGYLNVIQRPEIHSEEIRQALNRLGIVKTDTLLVHASVSSCGYIAGGANSIIDALRDTADTALFTTFTRPYIYLGGPNQGWDYRPHDPADCSAVWTGAIGKAVLKNYPDAVHSRHITHSWAGFGSHAHACLDAHGPFEPPTNEKSPPAKAMELGGKVLFFGCGLSSNTFLHYVEDYCRLPYLDTAVCTAYRPDGSVEIAAIPRHLPGDRDFYRPDYQNSKFYRRAAEKGLDIRETSLGIGKLHVMDLRQLFRIAAELVKEDPRVLLCDDPKCLFCSRF